MNVHILVGDARERLAELGDESVHCVVTSPPYYGLRNYGVPGQIGLEASPQEWVATMVAVMREVGRVLRRDGTCWLNVGDSYAGGGKQAQAAVSGAKAGTGGAKPKDLLLIPHRLAIALQNDGWYVRSDVIWAKPNPMPESVTDRPVCAHEHVLLLTKSPRYYYDAEAVRQPAAPSSQARLRQDVDSQAGSDRANAGDKTNSPMKAVGGARRAQRIRAEQLAEDAGLTEEHLAAIRAVGMCDAGKAQQTQTGFDKNTERMKKLADEAKQVLGGYYREFLFSGGRHLSNVWRIATRGYKEAHFATFPPELPRTCIQAGCAAGGVVLDPFLGAGTTALAAQQLQREAIGIELNRDYADMAARRLRDEAPLMADVSVDHGEVPA